MVRGIMTTTKIRKKVWYSKDIFGLEVYLPGTRPFPGQFFQVRVSDSYDPFLNRPLSVASYTRGRVLFVARVVGRGTRLLSAKKQGESIAVLGPFGKPLTVKHKKSLLIAGGIGVAPLHYVAQVLSQGRIPFTFIYGAKTPSDLILKNSLRRLTQRTVFVTEHGSRSRMTAVQALDRADISDYEVAYACGPRAMLRELQERSLPIPVYAFCEDFLGCGCGLCLGCALLYRGQYKRICEDGPVFELKDITFNV